MAWARAGDRLYLVCSPCPRKCTFLRGEGLWGRSGSWNWMPIKGSWKTCRLRVGAPQLTLPPTGHPLSLHKSEGESIGKAWSLLAFSSWSPSFILGAEMIVAPFPAFFSPPVLHMRTKKRGTGERKALKDQSGQGFAQGHKATSGYIQILVPRQTSYNH